jgi:hypothetical protein
MRLRITVNEAISYLFHNGALLRDATASGNIRVLISFLGPAYRGFIQQRGKDERATDIKLSGPAQFDWQYKREYPELRRLAEAAKTAQWNATTDIDWSRDLDFLNPDLQLLPDNLHPASTLPLWSRLDPEERAAQIHSLLSWLLSQFLHGEQGALFAAAQTIQSVPWLDAKLYGSTQVVDEGRHVEVFHNYLTQKLEKLYQINDNLYVVIDAIMSDSRWDMKFLGMQIMIEGLALGAFGTIRQLTGEPLLKEILKYIITDEARHVHYGVLALQQFYKTEVSERERRDREDWAFELSLLLRNRFLLHELYDEFYAHQMSRIQWNQLILNSQLMNIFRKTMFRRIIPNLKRIGLLSDRVRSRYSELGLLAFENNKAAPELTVSDLF